MGTRVQIPALGTPPLEGRLRELHAAVEDLDRGRNVAVAIIVKKSGSAPRDVGAKMLVREDGSTLGTLGGGAFERMVRAEALRALRAGRPSLTRYVFREDAEAAVRAGLICGGELEVYVDVHTVAPRVLLVGAGHLARAIAATASMAGFRVAVADPDPKLANKTRFPEAEKIAVEDFEASVEQLEPTAKDLLLVVCGIVEEDYKVLRKALGTPVRYVGVLGSKSKSNEFLKRLKAQGYRERQLRGRLYLPIGIDIGADTPEEIAVAVVAEMIALLKGSPLEHLSII